VRLRYFVIRQPRAFVPEKHRDFSPFRFLDQHLRRDSRGD